MDREETAWSCGRGGSCCVLGKGFHWGGGWPWKKYPEGSAHGHKLPQFKEQLVSELLPDARVHSRETCPLSLDNESHKWGLNCECSFMEPQAGLSNLCGPFQLRIFSDSVILENYIIGRSFPSGNKNTHPPINLWEQARTWNKRFNTTVCLQKSIDKVSPQRSVLVTK